MSTIKVNAIQNTSGVEVYTAKAWVNFNGTGTVAIRASGNVSSITDNGVGDYTVNFTTAMVDANYSFGQATNQNLLSNSNGFSVGIKDGTSLGTTGFTIAVKNIGSAGGIDTSTVCVSVFR